MQTVYVCYRRIYLPADTLLLGRVRTLENNTRRIQVIDFLKRYMLGLHLVPYGINRLDPRLGSVFKPHGVEFFKHRLREIVVDFGAVRLGSLYFLAYLPVGVGMFILET